MELDERLGDRDFVGQQLAEQAATSAGSSQVPPEAPNEGEEDEEAASAGGGPEAGAHFALGAQLDADASLAWFADEPAAGWPRQVCRLCAAPRARPEGVGGGSHSRTNCSEFGAGAELAAGWLRPLVASLQALCALATLALIGILLRVRKSRVS